MFSVQVRPASDAAVLQLRGELDVESVVQLEEAAHTVLTAQPPPHLVVVDCASLSFCDSSGIGGFVRLYQRLAAQEGQLRLAAPPAAVTKVFSLTGLDSVIAVHTSTQAALGASCDVCDRVADVRAGTSGGERGVG
ncbi:STAS domain-containing protein [Streptomyces globisporus]|uniref:STAS domain-containing protein n=1 Tax=Streptomyces globisporus TaxID=1908 RepID=UPI003663EFF1